MFGPRYEQIIFTDNPDEVRSFLSHLDSTPEEDKHIIAGQYDHGDGDGRTFDSYPLYPGDEWDRYGSYVVVRNDSLTYVVIYRDDAA